MTPLDRMNALVRPFLLPWVDWFRGGRIIVGNGTFLSRKATLRPTHGSTIKIGKGCTIHDYAMLLTHGGSIEIGDKCNINPFCILYGHGGLKIGNCVGIASHSVMVPASHVFDDPDKPFHEQGETRKGIVIHDDVWIATGVRILDGVEIGRGAVISAGSVVSFNVPPFAIVAGNPGRVIKFRGNRDPKLAATPPEAARPS